MAAEEGHEENTSSQTAKTLSSASTLFVGMSTRIPCLDSDPELDEESDGMSQGIALMERIVNAKEGAEAREAIELALVTLKEDGSCQIGHLVDCGAPLILTRCLARSLGSKSRLDEVPNICELLLTLFRSSTFFATRALQQIVAELFPLLLCVLHLSQSMSDWKIPMQAMKLIDRVSSLPIQLDHVRDRIHLLAVFREAILMACVDLAEKTTLVGLFQLLTGLVLNPCSRREFFADSSLFQIILSNYPHLRKAHYHLVAFLLVASQDIESRKKMIRCPDFLKILSLVLREDAIETRKVAIALTKLIAMDRIGRSKLITSGGSTFFDALFENARNIELSESGLELVRQIICSDTATLFHDNDKLLLPLLNAENLDEDSSVLVAKVIYRLSGIFSTHAKGMGRFLEAILCMCSQDKPSKVRSMGAKSLVRQSQTEACNFFLLRTPAAVKVIESLAIDDNMEINCLATKIVGNLALNPLNHRILTRNASFIEPLTKAVDQRGSTEAIKALLKLADNSKCNQTLAKQDNVVSSLSKYGLLVPACNKELQRAALSRVMKLVALM